MRTGKLTLLLLLSTLLWGAQAFAAPPVRLRLVSDVWPPFTDVEAKPHEALDIVKKALLRGGVQIQSKIMTWTDAMAELEQGKQDGSTAVWKSPEREKFLLYSKPYLENRLLLVSRKGENVAFSSIAQLAGKRLALTKGYAYGAAITQVAGVTIVERKNDAECLRAVLAKEADYLLLDELMVHHLFQFYAAKANDLLATGKTPLARYPLHFAIRRDYPGAQEIIAEFDRNVAQMRVDGTYNIVLHVNWIQTDVNGDGVPDYVGTKKSAPKAATDPSLTQAAYPVFYPEKAPPDMGRKPTYQLDGKSYDNWGDAASTMRVGDPKAQGAYKYSTGVVLFGF